MAVKRRPIPETDNRTLARPKFEDPAVFGLDDERMFVRESDAEAIQWPEADNGSRSVRDMKG